MLLNKLRFDELVAYKPVAYKKSVKLKKIAFLSTKNKQADKKMERKEKTIDKKDTFCKFK